MIPGQLLQSSPALLELFTLMSALTYVFDHQSFSLQCIAHVTVGFGSAGDTTAQVSQALGAVREQDPSDGGR